MKRNLRLRREALTELTPGDLAEVRGGSLHLTVGDHCGPPFNTGIVCDVTAGAVSPTRIETECLPTNTFC